MKPETENWLKIAKSDLKIAELCFKNNCHSKTIEQCHACLEKLLKGIIAERNDIQPPKIHDLLELVSRTLISNIQDDIKTLFDELNDLYISTRYPDNFDIIENISKGRSADILKQTKEVFKWLQKQIN